MSSDCDDVELIELVDLLPTKNYWTDDNPGFGATDGIKDLAVNYGAGMCGGRTRKRSFFTCGSSGGIGL